jgi:oxepin-CoA hydrolase / 3-oxo-5,6-dehydrosuberyl-CoA semialdehyde dehydrogenase
MNDSLSEIIQHVDKLTKDTKPLWGKMTAQHMIEHLIFALRISNGKLTVGCFIPEERWSTVGKILMSERPLPKNFINPIIGENLIPLEFVNLAESKNNLRKEFEDFLRYFIEHPDATFLNPTFGQLNKAEWEMFHKKHFTHHFGQFGLL